MIIDGHGSCSFDDEVKFFIFAMSVQSDGTIRGNDGVIDKIAGSLKIELRKDAARMDGSFTAVTILRIVKFRFKKVFT